ncbi:MAG TPA: acyl-CoA synthetase [Acidimicrobiales bacterium]|nr:acyl-CoA synthetase [Acidimicrobiales bacterium]
MEHNLWKLFSAVAHAVEPRDAIVWRQRRLSYGALFDRTCRLANVLQAQGCGPYQERGDLQPWESGQSTVGLYMLNGPEYLEATLAGFAARTAPFNVNYRYVADELAYLLNDADTAALVFHARFAPNVAAVLPRLARTPFLLQVADDSGQPLLEGAVDYEEALAQASAAPPDLEHKVDDLYLLYTGGTTGMPKGTMWRQADIWVAALCADGDPLGDVEARSATAAASELQRILPNAPLMHGAAHWLALRALLSGGTVVLNAVVDRLDPVDVWSTIADEQVSATLFVGDAFARPLIDELERGSYDTKSLALIAVGGAITSPATKQRLHALLPHTIIADLAGSSETGSALSQISMAGSTPEGGVFSPNQDVAVLNADLTRRLEPGEAEIGWFAKQTRIPLGYLGDPAKTAQTFPTVDGVRWSVPGDRARLRHDGLVELLGRDSVTINSAGEKIFAEEVEQAILGHDDVADVIVVGRPSERWGEEVVAVVQLTPGGTATDEEVVQAAAQHLAGYKLPKAIVRVPWVLRSPAGKADYAWARQLASTEQSKTPHDEDAVVHSHDR